MNKLTILTPKNEPQLTDHFFSPYDILENLHFQTQKIFYLIDNFNNPVIQVKDLIEEVKFEISKLLQACEEAFDQRKIQIKPKSRFSVNLCQDSSKKTLELNESKQEILQIEASYEEKIINLEDLLKKSEESRQRIHSFHQDCIRQLDRELDEIMHDYKQKYKQPQQMGNILEELFSIEELEQERQVALGKVRESVEIKIKKLDESKGDKWDMNLESGESSGPPPDLEGSALILYDRLHDLKGKIAKIMHQDIENLAQKENTLNQAFLGSLPISMQSISGSRSIKLEEMLSSLENEDEKNEIQFEFQENLLTIDEKEQLIMTLIEKEGTNGRDVCLDDILSIENSEKQNKNLENSLSFLENSSKIKKTEGFPREIESKALEDSKSDLNIKLSPISTQKTSIKHKDLENLSQESSIVMNDNNTSSFISENSFLNEDRRKFKKPKKSEKSMLRRPKLPDHDDSTSSIFPPINTSSEDQSFRLPIENKNIYIRKLPLVPSKPACAPPKERFNVRGRSVLPIQSSIGNSSKVMFLQDNSMNKSVSPNAVNKLRMRRYKEMVRPLIKVLNKKLLPKEPMCFNNNHGMFY